MGSEMAVVFMRVGEGILKVLFSHTVSKIGMWSSSVTVCTSTCMLRLSGRSRRRLWNVLRVVLEEVFRRRENGDRANGVGLDTLCRVGLQSSPDCETVKSLGCGGGQVDSGGKVRIGGEKEDTLD